MKRVVTVLAAFAIVVVLTVAAQAEQTGDAVFNQKCLMCHVVKGKGGAIGPELTKVSARLTEKQLRAKIENPKKSNPSTSMPSFKTLPPADMNALIGFLKTLK